jgi:hypothetical protein
MSVALAARHLPHRISWSPMGPEFDSTTDMRPDVHMLKDAKHETKRWSYKVTVTDSLSTRLAEMISATWNKYFLVLAIRYGRIKLLCPEGVQDKLFMVEVILRFLYNLIPFDSIQTASECFISRPKIFFLCLPFVFGWNFLFSYSVLPVLQMLFRLADWKKERNASVSLEMIRQVAVMRNYDVLLNPDQVRERINGHLRSISTVNFDRRDAQKNDLITQETADFCFVQYHHIEREKGLFRVSITSN